MTLSFIIPVYKKKELFLGNLRANFPFLQKHEVIVVDDYSCEDIARAVTAEFPDVKVVTNPQNYGFSKTVNIGAEQATGEFLVFINSDVRLTHAIDAKIVDYFSKNGNLFAVSFAQIEKDGRTVGRNMLFFKGGFFQHSAHDNVATGNTGWAEGGAMACRKEFFEELGGFCELYSPFYWEDIDLSVRANMAGYNILFASDICVEHHHESTIGTYFSQFTIQSIAFRNQLIFTWLYMPSGHFVRHIMTLLTTLARSILKGNLSILLGCLKSFIKLPGILAYRRFLKNNNILNIPTLFDKLEDV